MEAYERVLGDAMAGDSTLFARQDYVEEAWRIVDRALTELTPVYGYEPSSGGPKDVQHIVTPPGGWDELADEGAENFRIVKPSGTAAQASQLISV
jgi:glucose-6-phosphate 1-dehydrogenase